MHRLHINTTTKLDSIPKYFVCQQPSSYSTILSAHCHSCDNERHVLKLNVNHTYTHNVLGRPYVSTCMYVLFRSIQHQRGIIYTVWYDLKYVDQGAYLEVLRLLLSQRLSPERPLSAHMCTYMCSYFWATCQFLNKCTKCRQITLMNLKATCLLLISLVIHIHYSLKQPSYQFSMSCEFQRSWLYMVMPMRTFC